MKTLLALTCLTMLLIGCATSPSSTPAAGEAVSVSEAVVDAPSKAPDPAPEPEAPWGIEIVGIRQTSGGFMLDFRFRVLDAVKAAPLFIRATKPYLLDPATGATFQVPSPPKTGPLRTSDQPKEGIVYWMFFANPGRYLKPGANVTVVIGEFKAENLVVE